MLVPPGDPRGARRRDPPGTPAIGKGGLAAYQAHASETVLGPRWRSLIESVL